MREKGGTRRTFLQTAGSGVLGSLLVPDALAASQSQGNESWPQVGFNSRNTNHAPDNTGPLSNVTEEWHFNSADVSSAPVVADGSVYVGGTDGVCGISLHDGSEQWMFETDGRATSPAVLDGNVYVGAQQQGSQYGHMYSVSGTDGSEQWTYSKVYEGFLTPTIYSNTVYSGSFGSNPSVFALSASDGGGRWQVESEGGASRLAVTENSAYYAQSPASIRALRRNSGSQRWRNQVMTSLGPPTVVNGSLFIGESTYGSVYAFSADDGEGLWSFRTPEEERYGDVTGITVANDVLYVGVAADGGGYVVAISTDGVEQWRVKTPSGVISSPVVAGSTLYAGDADGNLYALSPDSGSTYWQFSLGAGIQYAPVVVESTIYVATEDGLYAVSGDATTPTPSPTPSPTPTATAEPTVPNTTVGDSPVDGSNAESTPFTNTTAREASDDGIHPPSIVLGILGLGGTGGLGLAMYRYWSSSEGRTDGPDPTSIQKDARQTVEDGDRAKASGAYETAVTAYTDAIQKFERAKQQFEEKDRSDRVVEIEGILAEARESLADSEARLAQLTAVREPLQDAESSLQTAIAEHVRGQITVARRDYREAAVHYETALSSLDEGDYDILSEEGSITVPVNIVGDHPPEKLIGWSNLSDSEYDVLSKAGLGTITDLKNAGEETIDTLLAESDIDDELADRLRAVLWWHGVAERTFTNRRAIERQYDRADGAHKSV